MENRAELLDIAFKYLLEKKKSSFNDIWNHLKKELKISPELEEKVVGNLYTGMVLDSHFFLKSDKLWYPRSEVTLEEVKSQVSSIQDDNQNDDTEFLEEAEFDETNSFDNDAISILEDKYGDGDDESEDLEEAISKIVLKEEFGE